MNRDVCEHFSPQELCAECNHSAICMCQKCRDVESTKLCERLIVHSIYINEKTRGKTIAELRRAIGFLFDEKIIAAAIDKFRLKGELIDNPCKECAKDFLSLHPDSKRYKAMQDAINEFCKKHDWAVDEWKSQPQIKALFDMRTAG